MTVTGSGVRPKASPKFLSGKDRVNRLPLIRIPFFGPAEPVQLFGAVDVHVKRCPHFRSEESLGPCSSEHQLFGVQIYPQNEKQVDFKRWRKMTTSIILAYT